MPEQTTTDVFISGAGPAGLACAIALARNGLTVHIADGMQPPIDKACGEGLMPDTLSALTALGIDIPPALSAPIHGIRFLDATSGRTAEALFPSTLGRGIKRLHLYQLLLDRATALGVHFLWNTVVQRVVQHVVQDHAGQGIVETNRGSICARYIIGADGHQSRIRACANLDRASTTTTRIGLRQHFAVRPWTSFVEVHWGEHGQAYITPVSSTEVCVAFVSNHKFTGGVPEALSHFPQLEFRLANATPSDAPRGSFTLSRKLHRVTRNNIALVGDASGSVDAVTGEGLSLCFRQALALADAITKPQLTLTPAQSSLASYQRAHTAMRRLPHIMAASMLLMDRHPLVRSATIATFSRHPGLFARLLALHTGHTSLETPMATSSQLHRA